jgi:hypothetical protein
MKRTAKKEEETRTTFPPISMVWVMRVAGVALIGGLIWAFGASIPAVIVVWLGFKLIRLAIRLFGLAMAFVYTAISIMLIIIIISLIIL